MSDCEGSGNVIPIQSHWRSKHRPIARPPVQSAPPFGAEHRERDGLWRSPAADANPTQNLLADWSAALWMMLF
jgi:hypothetical protein